MTRRAIAWILLGSVALAGLAGLALSRRAGRPSEGADRVESGSPREPAAGGGRMALGAPSARIGNVEEASPPLPDDPSPGAVGADASAPPLPPAIETADPAQVGARHSPLLRVGSRMDGDEGKATVASAGVDGKIGDASDLQSGSARRMPGNRPAAAIGGPLQVSARAPARAAGAPGLPPGAVEGAASGGTGIGLVVDDTSHADGSLPSVREAVSGSKASTASPPEPASPPLGTAGTSPDPDPIVTPLDVVQVERRWQDDVMQTSFLVMIDDSKETATPSGLIVCQQIPAGWEVVRSEPAVQAVDKVNGVAKWLFVGDAVTNNTIYSLSMRATNGTTNDWARARAWYTYRQPDGQCREVNVIPHGGN